ncbi:hypothetical protein [Kribbella sp. CA-294648]|uniref:hypothetical protein n=1 Tax=Kribbella sp. CA-294648 TaxID=3239948 RepID=UPI003D92424B
MSFFITARWAGQSDRVAFTDVVIEQLAEVLQEPMPSHLTDATRDLCFLDLLDRAAQHCQAVGQRLALLVDGLDEDRGVTSGPDAYSIAALLPAKPPPNLRIIVAGRPNPPIPTDVDATHPLRNPAIIRPLGTAPQATVIKRDMLRELSVLLQGSPADQHLLGLVTAAGGGLSAHDLAELTQRPRWEVIEYLGTVAGRTFGLRQSRWQPGTGPEVYVLGHEELQMTAIERLGEQRLAAYRSKLHLWADAYRQAGWPPHTPEYLLRGYLQLLRSSSETDRVVSLALDAARHDRMLDLSGGDGAAFTEIEVAFDLLLPNDEADLVTMSQLARRRDALRSRNENIPVELPALWFELGFARRAEALAQALPGLDNRAESLACLAVAVAESGNSEWAVALAQEATAASQHRSLILFQRDQATQAVAEAWIEIGDFAQAEAASHRLSDLDARSDALGSLSEALVALGRFAEAERIIATIPSPDYRAYAMADLIEADFVVGDIAKAVDRVGRALEIACTAVKPFDRLWPLRRLAAVTSAGGQHAAVNEMASRAQAIARTFSVPDPIPLLDVVIKVMIHAGRSATAATLAEEAARIPATILDDAKRYEQMISATEALLTAGNVQQATTMARSISDPIHQARALRAVAETLDRAGRRAESARLLDESVSVAAGIDDTHQRGWSVHAAVEAMIKIGELRRGESAARSINQLELKAEGLTQVARAVRAAGDLETALALASEAEEVARSSTPANDPTWAVVATTALIAIDECDLANTIAQTIDEPTSATYALVAVSESLASIGDLDGAGRAAGQAEAAARLVLKGPPAGHTWPAAVLALAKTGLVDQAASLADEAEAIARSFDKPKVLVDMLGGLIRCRAGIGDRAGAKRLAEELVSIVLALAADEERAEALAAVAQELAATDLPRAEAVAKAINDPDQRVTALCGIATEAVLANDLVAAGRLIAEGRQQAAGNPTVADERRELAIKAICDLATAMAATGAIAQALALIDEAEELSGEVSDSYVQSGTLADVCQALAAAGELDRAEALLPKLCTPEHVAASLATLAQKLPSARARTLIARAFAAGSKYPPLEALGPPFRDVLTTVGRGLCERPG